MHFKGLDLNLLVALDALLSERNVTRAAERVHMSQPGMSAALQKLRWHFSDQLLERVGRRLDLTPRARALVEPLQEALFHIANLVEYEPQFDPRSAQRVFRLAMSNVCSEMIGGLLAEYLLEQAPGISCQIDDLSLNSLSGLTDGLYDICITIAERTLLDPSFAEEVIFEEYLFSDRLVLVGAEGNTALRQDLEFSELCELPYAEVRFGGDVVSMVEQSLRRHKVRPRPRMWLPGYLQLISLISRTEFVAAIPERMFLKYRASLGLRAVPLPFHVPELLETAVWHVRHQEDPAHEFLRAALKEVVSRLVERTPTASDHTLSAPA